EKKAFCQGVHVLGSILVRNYLQLHPELRNLQALTQRFRRPYGKKRVSLRATENKVSIPPRFRRLVTQTVSLHAGAPAYIFTFLFRRQPNIESMRQARRWVNR